MSYFHQTTEKTALLLCFSIMLRIDLQWISLILRQRNNEHEKATDRNEVRQDLCYPKPNLQNMKGFASSGLLGLFISKYIGQIAAVCKFALHHFLTTGNKKAPDCRGLFRAIIK